MRRGKRVDGNGTRGEMNPRKRGGWYAEFLKQRFLLLFNLFCISIGLFGLFSSGIVFVSARRIQDEAPLLELSLPREFFNLLQFG